MKSFGVFILLLLNFQLIFTEEEKQNITFNKHFGGEKRDEAFSVRNTRDGGFIIVGFTDSFGNGKHDLWLIKTNKYGNILWDKVFGGKSTGVGFSVQELQNGDFIICGTTQSLISTTQSLSSDDAWLIKTDKHGDKLWDKTFGGEKNDYTRSVQETRDGGFILAGYTESFGAGKGDAWLIKTDKHGDKLWDKTFGGEKLDIASSVQETREGGFILAGYTESFGAGKGNAWLIKADKHGDKLWDKTFDRNNSGQINSIQETRDGFISCGSTISFATRIDGWLIKTDKHGNKLWDKTFGGEKNDYIQSVQETRDGNFIMAGYTESFGAGKGDAWLIKTDKHGDKLWDKTFGGEKLDIAESVQETANGGFIIAGCTESFGVASREVWLIRTNQCGEF